MTDCTTHLLATYTPLEVLLLIEKYPLLKELDKTMFIFEKEKTDKSVSKLLFETAKYTSVELIKSEYPAQE